MTDEHEARAKRIFLEAVDLAPERRSALLDRECAGDDGLRRRVERLLASHDGVGEFLADPPAPPHAPAAHAQTVTGTTLGRYRLLEKVGEGGFADVYMAEQGEPVRRTVALKILKPGMDSREIIARFEAERQALALMDHPHIAKVFDGGTTPGGRPYFVMELVRGLPITDYCDQAGLATDERLRLLESVCHAVQHAHQKGVIHRDIKPSNVLVTMHDGDPVPKVIDFGIAKAIGIRLTEKTLSTGLHQMIGTLEYMAPEQVEMSGIDIDTRADVYALGVLAYELITGAKPFEIRELLQPGFAEVLRQIREVEPPRPSTRISTMDHSRRVAVARRRGVPPAALGRMMRGDLDWIVMKALDKDRRRRYATASDVAQDLARYRRHEPVVARPPSATYRIRKYIRRHTIAVGAAAAVVLSLVVGTVVAVQGRIAAERSAAETRKERDATKAALRTAEGRRLAAVAGGFVDSDPTLALLLGREAARLTDDFTVRSVLLSALGEHFESGTLIGHDAYVTDARFDPSGRRVLTVAQERTALLWDVASRRVLRRLVGHTGEVRWGEFDATGERVLTASTDGTARIWDAATGAPVVVLSGSGAALNRARFSPSGARIVTSPVDGAPRVFDASTGDELHVLNGHGGEVFEACWLADDVRLATLSVDRTLRIWELPSGTAVHVLPAAVKGVPWRWEHGDDWIVVSPGGALVYTRTGEAYETGTGDPVPQPAVRADRLVDWSRSAGRAIVKPEQEALEIRDVATGATLAQLPPGTRDARFADDNGRIVTACGASELRVFDGTTGALLAHCRGHAYQVWRTRLSPDGRLLVSASADGTARLWDLDRARRRDVLCAVARDGRGASVQIARDRSVAVVSRGDPRPEGEAPCVVVDLRTGEVLREVVAAGGPPVTVGELAKAGTGLVLIEAGTRVRVYDVRTGATTTGFPLPPGTVRVAPSPDGRWLAAVYGEGETLAWQVFDAADGAPLGPPGLMPDRCGGVRCTSDGRTLITVHSEALPVLILWDVNTGRERARLVGHSGFIEGLEITPGGSIAATRAVDGTARTWDLVLGRSIAVCRGVPMQDGTGVVLSDDGRFVAVLTAYRVLLYDARTGASLARADIAPSDPSRVVRGWFTADGEELQTVDAQGRLQTWPLDPVAAGDALAPRKLTPAERARFDVGSQAERDQELRNWALEHESPAALNAWGQRCIDLGDLDGAYVSFERAMELFDGSAPAHLGHAVVHALRARAAASGEPRRRHVDEGLAALDRALSLAAPGRVYDPTDARLDILRADPRCAAILRRYGR